MEKFTASEVREQAETFGKGRVYYMLRAYAARLEADEMVVPVAFRYLMQLSAGAFAWSAWLPMDCINNRAFPGDKIEYAYTHPAPSDAERLAEALRKDSCPHGIRHPHPCRECEDNVPMHDDLYRAALGASGRIHRWRTEGAQPSYREWMELEEKLDKALAAHSAQAQPPAASVLDGVNQGLLIGTSPDGRPYAMRGTPESVAVVSAMLEHAGTSQQLTMESGND